MRYYTVLFFFLAYFTLYAAAAKSLQSCPTLCDPIDSSPPGSAVPGILQARTLEWGAIAFSSLCIIGSNFIHLIQMHPLIQMHSF